MGYGRVGSIPTLGFMENNIMAIIASLVDGGLHILLEFEDGTYDFIDAPKCIDGMGNVTQMKFTEDSIKAFSQR